MSPRYELAWLLAACYLVYGCASRMVSVEYRYTTCSGETRRVYVRDWATIEIDDCQDAK